MPRPAIFDGETRREMTVAEYEQWQTDNAEAQTQVEAQQQAQIDKAAARQAVLDKLGLTEQEIAALFG